MKHANIDTALAGYWIDQCGRRDDYLMSPIFQQSKQIIDRDGKENGNDKRKRGFAEAAESEEVGAGPQKRKHKHILSKSVSSTHCALSIHVYSYFSHSHYVSTYLSYLINREP